MSNAVVKKDFNFHFTSVLIPGFIMIFTSKLSTMKPAEFPEGIG
jgi:hypothetical protein